MFLAQARVDASGTPLGVPCYETAYMCTPTCTPHRQIKGHRTPKGVHQIVGVVTINMPPLRGALYGVALGDSLYSSSFARAIR